MGSIAKNVKSGSIMPVDGNEYSPIEKFDLCLVLGLKSKPRGRCRLDLSQSVLCCKMWIDQ